MGTEFWRIVFRTRRPVFFMRSGCPATSLYVSESQQFGAPVPVGTVSMRSHDSNSTGQSTHGLATWALVFVANGVPSSSVRFPGELSAGPAVDLGKRVFRICCWVTPKHFQKCESGFGSRHVGMQATAFSVNPSLAGVGLPGISRMPEI